MAITGVLRPGHAQIRVIDLEKSLHFYRNVLGLVETGKDDQGRYYFKGWDERDHHSVILNPSQSAGLDFFGFKVRDTNTLNKFESDLKAYGLSVERIKAGDLLKTGERLRFEIPTGHLIELYAEKEFVAGQDVLLNPTPWNPQTSEHGISPLRMDHCLMYGPNVDKVQDIFTTILGFNLTEYVIGPDGKTTGGIFLSCSGKAHDIAFVNFPEPGKLHHVSFLIESWEKVLRAGDIMSMNRVPVDIGPTRHGITRGTTIYAFDPSGNRFETYCGGSNPYPDWEPIKWTWDSFDAGLDYPQRKLHESFLTVVT